MKYVRKVGEAYNYDFFSVSHMWVAKEKGLFPSQSFYSAFPSIQSLAYSNCFSEYVSKFKPVLQPIMGPQNGSQQQFKYCTHLKIHPKKKTLAAYPTSPNWCKCIFLGSFSSRASDIPAIFLSDAGRLDACVARQKGGTVPISLKIGYEGEIIFS